MRHNFRLSFPPLLPHPPSSVLPSLPPFNLFQSPFQEGKKPFLILGLLWRKETWLAGKDSTAYTGTWNQCIPTAKSRYNEYPFPVIYYLLHLLVKVVNTYGIHQLWAKGCLKMFNMLRLTISKVNCTGSSMVGGIGG